MKYYFILTDGKDAWMQFVYLLREIMYPAISVTCRVWEYPYMTMTLDGGNTTHCRAHIGTYKAEHERIKKIGWQKHPLTIT